MPTPAEIIQAEVAVYDLLKTSMSHAEANAICVQNTGYVRAMFARGCTPATMAAELIDIISVEA